MKFTDLPIGIKLELEVIDKYGEEIRPTFISEFEWSTSENTAFIAAPIHEGVIYPIQIGAVINVYYIHKGQLYKFKSSVLERSMKENLALLKIEILSDIQKVQRRQFYRFECLLPIRYKVVKANQDHNDNSLYKEAITRNISGGGLCIMLRDRIDINKLIECELELTNNMVVKFLGRVIRVSENPPNMKYTYEVGVWFEEIDDKDRETLIGYIFMEQRRLRKKGLI